MNIDIEGNKNTTAGRDIHQHHHYYAEQKTADNELQQELKEERATYNYLQDKKAALEKQRFLNVWSISIAPAVIMTLIFLWLTVEAFFTDNSEWVALSQIKWNISIELATFFTIVSSAISILFIVMARLKYTAATRKARLLILNINDSVTKINQINDELNQVNKK
jgi:hypothetical protein